jgi:hypothetical protein
MTSPLTTSAQPTNRSRGNSLTLGCFLPQTPKKRISELPAPVRGESCPWKTPEPLPASYYPISSSPSSTSSLSLHEIQREEEYVRQKSSIKALRGNTVPWLLDRNTALINSFEAVMKSQADDLREQDELREALAAVARFEATEEEEKKMKGRRRGARVGSGDERYRRKKEKVLAEEGVRKMTLS